MAGEAARFDLSFFWFLSDSAEGVSIFGGGEGGLSVEQEEAVVDWRGISFSLVEHIDLFVVDGDEGWTEEVIVLAVVAFQSLGLDQFFEVLVDHGCDAFEADGVVDEKDLE